MRQKEQNRVLGPYEDRGAWKLVVMQNGTRTKKTFHSQKEAERMKRHYENELQRAPRLTLSVALTQYKDYSLNVKQNRPRSVESAFYRLRAMFPRPEMCLEDITSKQGIACYYSLFENYKVATHRRALTEAKTFLDWCVKNKWISKNPFQEIEGQGKCNKGKKQLRFDEARTWLKTALELAEKEDGAVAALITLLLGLRASEVIALVTRDVDDQGKLLWVPGEKSKAAKRTLEVPSLLQPFLAKLAKGKDAQERLFGHHWRDWPREWVQKICKKADVPVVTAHGMRGLHSTLALQAGTSPHAVAMSLGHASYKTTLEHYAAPGSMEVQQYNKLMQILQPEERRISTTA